MAARRAVKSQMVAEPSADPDGAGHGVADLVRQAGARLQRGEDEERQLGATHAAVLDALPAHVALLDANGTIVSANGPWRRFTASAGWRHADYVVGGNYPLLCDASVDQKGVAGRAAQGIRSVLSGEVAQFSMEYHCPGATGKQWFRMTVTSLAGASAGAVVMHVDISEFKNAEESMRRSTDLLRAVVDGSPDPIFVKDAQSRFLMCNQATASLAGRTVEQMIGQDVFAIYPQAVARVMREGDRRVIDEGRVFTAEEVISGAGGTRTVLTSKAPFRNEQGKVVGVLGIVRDITERKDAERERERGHQLLRTLIDALPDAIYTKDRGGRFVISNQATRTLFGLQSEQELAGKTVFDLMPVEAANRIHAADLRVLAGRPMLNREETSIDQDGATRWHLAISMPLRDGAGPVGGFVGIKRDITELKRDQDALRELNAELELRVETRTAELSKARNDAEQANRAKSAFLATMSHEIRTPMNGVVGMLDVLHRTSLKAHQVEMVDLIRDSAFSMLRIIEDVLDFSTIEAGKLSVEKEPIQVAETVEKVCAMLDQMAVDRGVAISVFVDPAIPPTVLGDEIRLRQVLVNLTSNAIKFSSGREQSGRVSVRALLVARQGDTAAIDLVVADNGIGMDEATVARLFTPFSQADVPTTRRHGGSGLGLAISEMLVYVMGGAISVESTPGRGSTFTVHLPFSGASDPAAENAPGPAPPLNCRIVGAEQPLAGDLVTYLEHAGHNVLQSPDLAAASRVVQSPGLWLWLVLPGPHVPSLPELRAMASGAHQAETRFILFGRGRRRRPRVEAADLISIDADLLFRATLFDVLALAAGRRLEEVPESIPEGDLRPAPGASEAAPPGRVILVAEDNETNRKVILLQLQLLGFSAVVASNGREALERWRRGAFALLLTDLHMPEMDGYALAMAIRAEETSGSRLPIVALTAKVMRDEELRCRAAGMDSYLSKPVCLPQLKEAIEVWLVPPDSDKSLRDAAAAPADIAVLVALVGDDPAVIAEVLLSFRQSAAQTSAELTLAVDAGSAQAVAEAAHKLKSAARSIGAHRLGEICAEIEQSAEVGQAETLNRSLGRFATELNVVGRFLDSVPGAAS